MLIKTEIEIEIPPVPDHFTSGTIGKIRLCNLTADQLQAVANEWANRLYEKAQRQKHQRIRTEDDT